MQIGAAAKAAAGLFPFTGYFFYKF